MSDRTVDLPQLADNPAGNLPRAGEGRARHRSPSEVISDEMSNLAPDEAAKRAGMPPAGSSPEARE